MEGEGRICGDLYVGLHWYLCILEVNIREPVKAHAGSRARDEGEGTQAFRLNEDLSRGSHQGWMGSCEEKAAESRVGEGADAYVWRDVPRT